jgi:hypothetical protein
MDKASICVLAGSKKQYAEYLNSKPEIANVCVHGATPEIILARTFTEVRTTGSFWHGPDADALYQAARSRLWALVAK